MPNDTPQSLPPDFFAKQQKAESAPTSLPPDFFAKQGKPIDTSTSISAQPSIWEKMKSSAKSVAMDPFNLPGAIGSMTSPIEHYTQEGRAEHPVLSRLGDVTKGTKEFAGLAGTALSLTGGEGIAGAAAGEVAAGKAAAKAETSLQKINKILGVTKEEVVPGKVPASLSEFANNPARGVVKSGIDAKQLAKANPLERNISIMAARDAAGKALDEVLTKATQEGKTVNIQGAINKTFKEIADPKLADKAAEKLHLLFEKAGLATKPLSQFTPMEARTVQRALDEFANFSGAEEAQSFKDIATQLRRGISEATRKSVPESAAFDQHYGDLANASSATQRAASEWASEVPEAKMWKFFKKNIAPALVKSAGMGAGGLLGWKAAESIFGKGGGQSPVP
ncbi:MAG TPA: hypothetical protein VH187_18725 [Scandinavium sp.]|jgi:hypothetical protein|uniref:hypothetical protein n=1 Tax=Scandinavium sp. TaxID=2830653 RepID=UPI002E318AA4|nr:hypothetical protein [Scandinavium sp.]HEX4503173.1 hypothetical protein [Scandinavium sp.]